MTGLDWLVERGSYLPEVPLFHGANIEQNRAVLRRTKDGKTDVSDQFFRPIGGRAGD